MLNLVFFDYPFIHIDRFCITLSSFFIMLFFLLSNGAHWYFWKKKVSQKGLIYTLERSKNYMEAKAVLVAWRIHVLLFLILASNIYRQPQKYSQYNYFG